jgi:3-oxoacyl-[acyl-carrier-protein] synthase-3
MTSAGIVGLGLWAPEEIRTNDAWPASFVQGFRDQRDARRARDFTHIEGSSAERPYDDLFKKHALRYDSDPFKGATNRRVTSNDIPTAECDARAGARALEDARIEPRDVDLVLSSALVADRLVPSNGPAIQALLKCPDVPGIGVEASCSSALTHLDLAIGLVESGRARHVLCVQSHHIGRINDLELPFSPIFGDASSAFVVGPVRPGFGVQRLIRGGDGTLIDAVTHQYKRTPNARWWLDAEGPIHPGSGDPQGARLIAQNVLAYAIDTIRALCAATATPADAVASFAMIQPMVWYQPAVADGLGLPAERFPSTYSTYAHLGPAGVVANLLEARRLGQLHSGANVVLYAHGAGLTRYAALLRWE